MPPALAADLAVLNGSLEAAAMALEGHLAACGLTTVGVGGGALVTTLPLPAGAAAAAWDCEASSGYSQGWHRHSDKSDSHDSRITMQIFKE